MLGASKAAAILRRSQLRLRFTPGATPCRWLRHEPLRASRASLSVPRLPRRELRLARARCAPRDVRNSTWFAAAHALQALPALIRRHPRDRVLPAAALTLGVRRRRRAARGRRLASCDRARTWSLAEHRLALDQPRRGALARVRGGALGRRRADRGAARRAAQRRGRSRAAHLGLQLAGRVESHVARDASRNTHASQHARVRSLRAPADRTTDRAGPRHLRRVQVLFPLVCSGRSAPRASTCRSRTATRAAASRTPPRGN